MGSSRLEVSWDFQEVTLSSLTSYTATCSADRVSSSKTVDTDVSSVDFDLGRVDQVECCVTAQQENHSNYRACSPPSIGLPMVAIIAGTSAAAGVLALGITAGIVIALVCWIKKRYD